MANLMPFVLAMVTAMAGLPLLAKFATKWGIVDQPGLRKVHETPVPRIGGIAMAIAAFLAAFTVIDLQASDRWFLLAAGVLVAFGAFDDRCDLDYRVKFIGQFLAVGIVVFAGDVQVRAITLDDRIMLPTWVSMPLTFFFLIGITNAVNLADGLDGLAGGTTFLCLCAVALLSGLGDHNAGTALCLAFAGAILGFLRFNTYPATVFMGDAGSQLLGFTIGVLSIRSTQSFSSQVSAAIPILLLAIPILDTLSVMVQRIGEGRSPFSPDKNHLHHKLLAFGFSHHEAVMVIYVVQAALFVVAYFLRYESDLTILAFVIAFFALAITILQAASRSGWRLRNAGGGERTSGLLRFMKVMREPKLLPQLSYAAIVGGINAYALLVVLRTTALSHDVWILVLTLLATTGCLLLILRGSPLSVVEKAALYVTATILVYLDATIGPEDRLISVLSWVVLSVATIGTAVRLRLQNDRRFQVTPLDLIVLFMALVVPSLPGVFRLPEGNALAIVKLIILFYSIEVLVSRAEGRAVWLRVAVVYVLGGLVLRAFIPVV
ncbi:MAG: MraY family glycosyltransferase [Steroidobacteraceae bacterium]|jgi:UDP-GlcNAc:undecaprenyl-phosphate GlcNAc-1-phosphate transferase